MGDIHVERLRKLAGESRGGCKAAETEADWFDAAADEIEWMAADRERLRWAAQCALAAISTTRRNDITGGKPWPVELQLARVLGHETVPGRFLDSDPIPVPSEGDDGRVEPATCKGCGDALAEVAEEEE